MTDKTSIKKSFGYSKVKTDLFVEKKKNILAKKDRFRRESDKHKLSTNGSSISLEMGSTGGLPPVWVDYYEESLEKLNQLDQITKEASKLINQRLKLQFGDHSDLDNQINAKGNQATQILHECEQNFNKIHKVSFNTSETAADKRIRENVERILATRIQEATMSVRRQQKSLLNRLKDNKDDFGGGKLDAHGGGFEMNDEMRQELEGMDEIARERDEDLNKLIDTINELSTLFKQMNQLVIEQGTIVDRIDYNLENAQTEVKKAKVQLVKAHKYQNSPCADYCIKVLVILIVIFSILLIIKFAKR